jgi:hypothetical protein
MTSIYARVLGDEFERLHPLIQRRFGLSSTAGDSSVGHGVMEVVWHGGPHVRPFLSLGATRKIFVPEQGRDVPFRIENYAYLDDLGRECVSWHRTFAFAGRAREFTATMVYSAEDGSVVDYLGDRQHLAVDLTFGVSDRGGILVRSGAQRLYEGRVGLQLPRVVTGVAEVEEWFDEDAGRFRIQVRVTNPLIGPVFGYRGSFEAEWSRTPALPAHVLPRRVEARL